MDKKVTMKPIYNKYLPKKGFIAINLLGIIFVRKDYKPISQTDLNHEKIHTKQIQELLFVFFYLWYGIEWIVRLIHYRNSNIAYRNISFEREAYANQSNLNYLLQRKPYAFTYYLSIRKWKA